MNEDELFKAYRSVADQAEQVWHERARAALVHAGSSKCIVGSCPTMIALYTGRVMCLFHEGKRRRGEL